MYVFFNDLISTLGLLLCSFYIFCKILNKSIYTKLNILVPIWCLFLSLGYAINPLLIPEQFIRPIFCITSIIFIFVAKLFVEERNETIISAFLLSFGLIYLNYYMSLVPITVIFGIYGSREYQTGTIIDYNTPIYLIIFSATIILQFTISYAFFQYHRFQSGFPFIREQNVITIALIIAAIVTYIATLINTIATSSNISTFPTLLLCLFTIAVGFYIWLHRAIKSILVEVAYKRENQLTEKENEALRKEIESLTEKNDILHDASHNISNRLKAMELTYSIILNKIKNCDELAGFRKEIADELERLTNILNDYIYITDVEEKTYLPSTKVKAIDDIFRYFFNRFKKEDVEFRLKVTGSIMHMCENYVPQDRLETLISDHLDDALNAINANDKNARRCIYVVIGESDGYYEFTVQDTGIPFEIETLTRLGTERITTRADSGGSGIGFMQTFATINECKASLIITEFKPNAAFKKSVSIKFDFKNKYIIQTPRVDEIPPSDRYEVRLVR